ncbi:MAG: hypothetical protein JHC78_13240 [Ilumatobacteraceae bacterium]|jgi:hypothetical protein|nr:hypothetical protein [Ilumatobacteraceae bacterium]MBJ7368965.1 hypothetical protein [Ilumatobacteraceae bacterium]
MSSHRIRRTIASILGGLGIAIFLLGVVAMVLIGFVSSSEHVESTVTSALSQSDIRSVIADELIKKLEEADGGGQETDGGGQADERLILQAPRDVVVQAVADKLNEESLQKFAGSVAAKVYAIYVDDAVSTPIDVMPLANAAMDTIKIADPSVSADEILTIEPLSIEKKSDDINIGDLRDTAKTFVWLFLILGLALQGAAWLLGIATPWQKIRRLGIRLFSGSVALGVVVLIARNQIPQSSDDNRDAVKAVTQFITSPIMTRVVLLTVLGVVLIAAGMIGHRKAKID